MSSKKKRSGKTDPDLEESGKKFIDAFDDLHINLGQDISFHGDKTLEVRAKAEIERKMTLVYSGVVAGGGSDEGDQTPLSGEEAQVLKLQWADGLDSSPVDPRNSHLSQWFRTLWCGDFKNMMAILKESAYSNEEVMEKIEERETLYNTTAIFHVIVGARCVKGDDPNLKEFKMIALSMLDVKDDHIEILEKLLEMGANPAAKDFAGYTPLHHCLSAVGNSTTQAMAQILLKAGVDPNVQNRFGSTPLFECVQSAKLDFIRLLLKHGGDPDVRDYDGWNCRQMANLFPQVRSLFSQADRKSMKAQVKASGPEQCGGGCGKTEDITRCLGCFLVKYCGATCQKAAWKEHKVSCRQARADYKPATVQKKYGVMINFSSKKEAEMLTVAQGSSSSQFVVKVQKPLADQTRTKKPGPLMIYDMNRSFSGFLHKTAEQEELYDSLVDTINREGLKGLKGFFYALHKSSDIDNIFLEINPKQVVKGQSW